MKRETPFFLGLLILVWMVLFLPFLGSRTLWEPDEPRQALMTLEMERNGLSLFPTLRSRLYTDYPPLSYWINLALGKGFSYLGLGEPLRHSWGYQLPSMIATLITAIFLFLLARTLYQDEKTGFLAALIFLLSPIILIQGQRAMLDPWLMAFITAYFYVFHSYLKKPQKRHYFFFGLLFFLLWMIKGPVGVLLTTGVSLIFLAIQKEWKRAFIFGSFLAALILLIGLWWYSMAYQSHGAPFFYEVMINQTLGRFLPRPLLKGIMYLFPAHAQAYLRINPDHERDFFYYILKFPLLFAPWILLWIPFWLHGWKEKSSRLPLLWWGVIFLLFSISKNKRTYYLLPLFPAAAILAGRGYYLALEYGKERFLKFLGYLLGSLYLLAGVLAPIAFLAIAPYRQKLARAFVFLDPLPFYWILCVGLAFCLAGFFLVALVRKRKWHIFPWFLTFSFMLLWICLWKSVLPGLEKEKNYAPFCASWKNRMDESKRLVFFYMFRDSIELHLRNYRPQGKWEYLAKGRIWKLTLPDLTLYWIPEELGMTYSEMNQKIPKPYLLITPKRIYKRKLENHPGFFGEWLQDDQIDNRLWKTFWVAQ